MSFHSRSAIGFGQLLNSLGAHLTEGTSVPAALDAVREHFTADAVALDVEQRGRGTRTFVSAEEDLAGDAETLGDLRDRFHCLRALSDAGAGTAYVLRVFRSPERSPFDQEESAVADVLVVHIARALDLAARIDGSAVEKSLYSDALDKLNVGVILVDEGGRLHSASAVADRFLGTRDGIQLQLGKLRATNVAEDRVLQAAIREAAECTSAQMSRGVSLTKESGARTLGVMVRPLPGSRPGTGARVAVYIRDCDSVLDVESEFVRQIFDLTPAEAAVTRRLTSGLSLEDAAISLDISRNTARAHLRSIFSKSGITRQTELVRLVLNSAALLGERPHQAA